MHLCLRVQEIVRNIVESIDGYENRLGLLSQDALSTVHALAITCKSFQDPALDRLWSCQDSLRPLMQCLPSSKWSLDLGYLVSGSIIAALSTS